MTDWIVLGAFWAMVLAPCMVALNAERDVKHR